MSNVFSRYHKPTGNEYWENALEIEKELTPFLMNTKNIPKRYLYIYAVPTMRDVQKLQNAIVEANTIYPTTDELVTQKKAAYYRAIIANEQIIQDLQRIILILNVDANKLERIGNMLIKESSLLRDCRKKVKLQSENPKA